MTEPLTIRCAWLLPNCEDLGKPAPTGPVSHILCPSCAVQVKAQALAYAAARKAA